MLIFLGDPKREKRQKELVNRAYESMIEMIDPEKRKKFTEILEKSSHGKEQK